MDKTILITSIQNLGLALLTLLVPLIFSAFQEAKGDLDRKIFFKKIISPLLLVISIVLIFSSSFCELLFKYNNLGGQELYLKTYIILAIIGLVFVINIIRKCFLWIFRTSKLANRIKYFIETGDFWQWWGYLLNDNDADNGRRSELFLYFNVFKVNMDDLLGKRMPHNQRLSGMVNLLATKMDKWQDYTLLYDLDNFNYILKWHWQCWSNSRKIDNDDIDKLTKENYHIVFREINDLIYRYFKYLTFENKEFLQTFCYYIDEYIKSLGEFASFEYVNSFSFYDLFFENAKKLNNLDFFLEGISNNWLITLSNIEKENNMVSLVLWTRYRSWAQKRIILSKGNMDDELEFLTYDLFPDTDHATWCKILYFFLSPFPDNVNEDNFIAKLNNFINANKPFGHMFHMVSYWVGDKEMQETNNEHNKFTQTIKLAVKLFGNWLSEENLKNYLKKLNQLEFTQLQGEKEESRKDLIKILEALLKELENV